MTRKVPESPHTPVATPLLSKCLQQFHAFTNAPVIQLDLALLAVFAGSEPQLLPRKIVDSFLYRADLLTLEQLDLDLALGIKEQTTVLSSNAVDLIFVVIGDRGHEVINLPFLLFFVNFLGSIL